MSEADSKPRAAKRSRRSSGAVTLHDVAKLAGVAPITASRALNTPQQVSEEVRKKVAEAIVRTGYVPNRLAGGLASARSRLVAAIVPTITGPVFSQSVEALTVALAADGYQLMLGQSGYAGSREDDLLDALIGRRPDGIVLTGIVHSPEGRRRLMACGVPVVETWDLTPTPIDMLVGFSHTDVGTAVADLLVAGKGRRQLAVIAGNDERAKRRSEAFIARARALGASSIVTASVPAPTTFSSGRQALRELLAAHRRIDGVFCSSDLLALGVLTEARAAGFAVPQRLSVVGFGDLDFAADTDPALTTVHIKAAEIGRQAARCIVDRVEGRPVEPRVIDIGFSIVERRTT